MPLSREFGEGLGALLSGIGQGLVMRKQMQMRKESESREEALKQAQWEHEMDMSERRELLAEKSQAFEEKMMERRFEQESTERMERHKERVFEMAERKNMELEKRQQELEQRKQEMAWKQGLDYMEVLSDSNMPSSIRKQAWKGLSSIDQQFGLGVFQGDISDEWFESEEGSKKAKQLEQVLKNKKLSREDKLRVTGEIIKETKSTAQRQAKVVQEVTKPGSTEAAIESLKKQLGKLKSRDEKMRYLQRGDVQKYMERYGINLKGE